MVMAIPRAVVALALLLVVSPLCSTAYFILYSPGTLSETESMNYGPYEFIMQTDCNLVLYENGKPLWASNTGGLAKNCFVTMQNDGNLVIYTKTTSKPVWASNTSRDKANYVLVLQKDRNVVIYGPAIWATNTYVGTSRAISITSKASTKVANSLPANVTHESNAAGNAIVGVGHN